jgi:hypothetical protein
MKYYIRGKEKRNIVHSRAVKRRKANILRRNWIIKRIIERMIEGNIEVMRRRGKRCRSYWMTVRKREDTGN